MQQYRMNKLFILLIFVQSLLSVQDWLCYQHDDNIVIKEIYGISENESKETESKEGRYTT